ncbi:hypothetical protein CsatB_027072 [Cannabis sativa]
MSNMVLSTTAMSNMVLSFERSGDGTIDKYPPDRSNRSYSGCWSYSSLYRRDRSIALNHQPVSA